MTAQASDPITPDMPGVDRLRKYSTLGRNKRLDEVLSTLNRAVVKPATDAYNVSWLLNIGVSFTPEENRSVTGEEWAFTALRKYGNQPSTTPAGVSAGERGGSSRPSSSARGVRVSQDSNVPTDSNAKEQGRVRLPNVKGAPAISHRIPNRRTASGVRQSGNQDNSIGGSYERPAYRAALSAVRRALGLVGGRRRVLSLAYVVDSLVHDNSFSSLPYLCSNDVAKTKGLRLAERIFRGERGFDPYLFGKRVQFGSGSDSGVANPKTRLV